MLAMRGVTPRLCYHMSYRNRDFLVQLHADEWCVKGRKMRYAKPAMEEPRIP